MVSWWLWFWDVILTNTHILYTMRYFSKYTILYTMLYYTITILLYITHPYLSIHININRATGIVTWFWKFQQIGYILLSIYTVQSSAMASVFVFSWVCDGVLANEHRALTIRYPESIHSTSMRFVSLNYLKPVTRLRLLSRKVSITVQGGIRLHTSFYSTRLRNIINELNIRFCNGTRYENKSPRSWILIHESNLYAALYKLCYDVR